MNITTIKYSDDSRTFLTINGTLTVPWPCPTWHREAIQEWLDEGGTIAPWKTDAVLLAEAREEKLNALRDERRKRAHVIVPEDEMLMTLARSIREVRSEGKGTATAAATLDDLETKLGNIESLLVTEHVSRNFINTAPLADVQAYNVETAPAWPRVLSRGARFSG